MSKSDPVTSAPPCDERSCLLSVLNDQAKICLNALHSNITRSLTIVRDPTTWCYVEKLEALLNLTVNSKVKNWSPLESSSDDMMDVSSNELLDFVPFDDSFYKAVSDFAVVLFNYSNSNMLQQDDLFDGLYRGMDILHALIYYYHDTGSFCIARILTTKMQSMTMQFYTNLPHLHTILNQIQKNHRQALIKSHSTNRTYAASLANDEAIKTNKRFQLFLQKLQYWIHALYKHSNIELRIYMRKLIGNYLQFMDSYLLSHGVSTGLSEMLEIVGLIQIRDEKVNRDLLQRLVMPLFYSNTLSSWRDQQCSLELYFQPLRGLVLKIVSRMGNTTAVSAYVIEILCSPKVWPHHTAHTGKQVLVLCLIQDLLAYLGTGARLPHHFFSKYLNICQSEHSRVAEKALLFFRDETFLRLLKEFFIHSPSSISPFLRALIRPGDVSWNPTVNKFTFLALQQSADIIAGDSFDRIIEEIFSGSNSVSLSSVKKNHLSFGKSPNVCVTGVAPWSLKGMQHISKLPRTSKKKPNIRSNIDLNATQGISSSAYQDYLDALVPKEAKSNKVQFYPDLSKAKFHDFVFGEKPLGSGSFSIVKYAKYICRTSSSSNTIDSSQWPEYAIKIVDKNKLAEFEYWGNINREIAILTLVNDVKRQSSSIIRNIVRLYTTFHLNGNVYMVMEYAPLGDLFNFIPIFQNVNQLRFIVNEVANGLAFIHNLGFVFGDLKPENILVCSDQHLKLTDFGAARPITSSSKEELKAMGNVLARVRDGYWKPDETCSTLDKVNTAIWDDNEQRVEGTKAYLSPEIIENNGKALTLSADIWALGCVLFQCMTGRIPVNIQEKVDHHVAVSFNNDNDIVLHGHVIRSSLIPEGHCHDLLNALLALNPSERISITQVLSHAFLKGEIEVLKAENNIMKTSLKGSGDEGAWARRQYSSIWAPLDPGNGNIALLPYNSSAKPLFSLLLGDEDNELVEEENVETVIFGNRSIPLD